MKSSNSIFLKQLPKHLKTSIHIRIFQQWNEKKQTNNKWLFIVNIRYGILKSARSGKFNIINIKAEIRVRVQRLNGKLFQLPFGGSTSCIFSKTQQSVTFWSNTSLDLSRSGGRVGQPGDSCNIFTCQAIAPQLLYYWIA